MPSTFGDDLRPLPLSMRKAHLERLLASRPDGIFISPFEQGEIGPDLFRAACNMGLEGLVSKRRDHPFRGRTVEGLGQGEGPQAPSNGARAEYRHVSHRQPSYAACSRRNRGCQWPLPLLVASADDRRVVDAPEDLSCWEQSHGATADTDNFLVVWINLAIAAVVGIAWRLRSGL